MNKPKLEITYARLDIPDGNTAPDKHNTDDGIHVGVTTGRLRGDRVTSSSTVTIELTEKELVFLTSLVESEKTRMFFEDPDVDKQGSVLHEDYSLSEKIAAKFGQSYASG